MRHRNYLTGLPAVFVARLAADIVGSKRGAALTRRLERTANSGIAAGGVAVGQLAVLAWCAAGVAFGVAVLGLAIAVELARKGA